MDQHGSMKYVLLTIVLISLVFPTLYSLLFLLSNYRAKSLPRVRKVYGGLWGPLAKCWLAALVSQALLLFLHLFFSLSLKRKKQGGPPVILVHGLYHNPSIWIPLGRTLRREGFGNLHAYGYSSFGPEFERISEGLVARTLEVLEANPGQKASFVGHSLGGLLIRKAIADPRLKGRVSSVVTLGSPHRGSEMARMAIGGLGRTLIPGDPILDGLNRLEEDADVPKLAVCSLVDEMVIPLSGLDVNGPGWSVAHTSPLSHVSLAYFPEPQKIVLDFLRRTALGGSA